MKQQIIESAYLWVNYLCVMDDSTINTIFQVSADSSIEEMKELLRQGIMTHGDINIVINNKDIIIADIESIINEGVNDKLTKHEIVKKLAMTLMKKHKLSWSYTKFIINELVNRF